MAKSAKPRNRQSSAGGGIETTRRTRKTVTRESPQQRSSIYRGVTRHRWTGRYEAHLWDKNCWNESQNKKGRQVYLGAYDDEAAAAHAYDLAALKYWGHHTVLNFPISTYQNELQEMEGQTKEEYISSLRRKSSGFSRGVSKYRGVARHHHNGRWEARIGRVFGSKYLYLGTYATQEEAATAYDMAAIEYRGVNAVTNFDLSRYVRPTPEDHRSPNCTAAAPDTDTIAAAAVRNPNRELGLTFLDPSEAESGDGSAASSAALGFLLQQSSKFKEMLEQTAAAQPEPPRSSFPEDIQTSFDFQDSSSYAEEHDIIFGSLGSFSSPVFQCGLDA